jgi:hypothetical protein
MTKYWLKQRAAIPAAFGKIIPNKSNVIDIEIGQLIQKYCTLNQLRYPVRPEPSESRLNTSLSI